jgi:formate dehydrogenase subunit gamma
MKPAKPRNKKAAGTDKAPALSASAGPIATRKKGESVHMSSHSEESYAVTRYTPLARVNHWITAGSLILLALSGMALFHPSLYFFTELFGGGENTRAVHPWIGLVLAISFLGLFIRFFRANLWNRGDNMWLGKLRSVLAGREDDLPELGKYNAGQKIVFWSQSILIVILMVSGIGLWEVYFGSSITIEQKRWSAVVHSLAAVAIILVWIVHVYAAIWVKGTVRGMMRGNVSGGWAWRHHRKWLREKVSEEQPPKTVAR